MRRANKKTNCTIYRAQLDEICLLVLSELTFRDRQAETIVFMKYQPSEADRRGPAAQDENDRQKHRQNLLVQLTSQTQLDRVRYHYKADSWNSFFDWNVHSDNAI